MNWEDGVPGSNSPKGLPRSSRNILRVSVKKIKLQDAKLLTRLCGTASLVAHQSEQSPLCQLCQQTNVPWNPCASEIRGKSISHRLTHTCRTANIPHFVGMQHVY